MDFQTVEERFWCKVEIKGEDDCWNWQAGIRGKSGYGAFKYEGKTVNSHRMSWFLTYGKIPDNLCVCHKCDNRLCCNPKHFFLGTLADNNKDMKSKGRAVACYSIHPELIRRGENCSHSKFNWNQVCDIREQLANGSNMEVLAKKYNVDPSSISAIRDNKSWKVQK